MTASWWKRDEHCWRLMRILRFSWRMDLSHCERSFSAAACFDRSDRERRERWKRWDLFASIKRFSLIACCYNGFHNSGFSYTNYAIVAGDNDAFMTILSADGEAGDCLFSPARSQECPRQINNVAESKDDGPNFLPLMALWSPELWPLLGRHRIWEGLKCASEMFQLLIVTERCREWRHQLGGGVLAVPHQPRAGLAIRWNIRPYGDFKRLLFNFPESSWSFIDIIIPHQNTQSRDNQAPIILYGWIPAPMQNVLNKLKKVLCHRPCRLWLQRPKQLAGLPAKRILQPCTPAQCKHRSASQYLAEYSWSSCRDWTLANIKSLGDWTQKANTNMPVQKWWIAN